MKKNNIVNLIGISILLMIAIGSCKKKDDSTPSAQKTTYAVKSKDLLGVTGTITIAEKSSGSTESVVTITLLGAPVGTHPAHIHYNSAIETGGIAYSLNSLDGSGVSTTVLGVAYNLLVNFDGYVNIHLDAATLGTIIGQADIGGNAITSSNKTYNLLQDSASGIFGTARFDKRKNGNTLVSINLTAGGVLPSGAYPAQINLGSVSTIGTPYKTKTLNPVDGDIRTSVTNIRKLDDGNFISYDNWMVYDGFMTIHNASDTTNVIAKGNIGAN
jgi:hypothetical protein